MLAASALRAYKTTELGSRATGGDKRELILMMYDGAIGAIRIGQQHAARKERLPTGKQIDRALSIIGGMRQTLDFERGGNVAVNLDDLYRYLMKALVKANSSLDTSIMQEVVDLLASVREAWASVGGETAGEVNQNLFLVRS